MQQGTNIHSSSCKQAVETRILKLRTPQMHYSGLSSNFRSVLTHLGSLEPIIYIIKNDTTRRDTEFRSIPISIACCCCVSKLTNEAFTLPPNPDVGSLFLYWDRGGTLSDSSIMSRSNGNGSVVRDMNSLHCTRYLGRAQSMCTSLGWGAQ